MTEHPALPATVTIAAVARELGVSTATVSKVLNGRSDVAEDTRARVEAGLERQGYQRRRRRPPLTADQIDVVFHEYDSSWTMEIINGIESVTAPAGVRMALSQLGGSHQPAMQWLDDVVARRPTGVLLVQCTLAEAQRRRLRHHGIPCVAVDSDSATSAAVPTVGSNNWNGGLLATRYLIGLGHRRIAHISGPPDMLCARARTAGYQAAHDDAGLPVDPDLVRHGSFYVGTGHRHGLDLLTRPQRPTAVFAGSDMQAMGVLRAARQLGLAVPADLSVVGYDDLPVASWTGPALTTVNQPLRDMAGLATQMLLDLSRGVEPATTRIDLVTQLVVRESTAPPANLP